MLTLILAAIPEWIPTVSVAVAIPVIGFIVGSREVAKITEVRLVEFKRQSDIEIESLRQEMLLRFANLKEELTDHKRNFVVTDDKRDVNFRDATIKLNEIYGQMHSMTQHMESVVREQNTVNVMTAKTLDSITSRLEDQATQMIQNSTNISLIREILSQHQQQINEHQNTLIAALRGRTQ